MNETTKFAKSLAILIEDHIDSLVAKRVYEDRLLGFQEACTILDVSRKTLNLLITNNALPVYMIGSRVKFRVSELHEWINRQHITNPPLIGDNDRPVPSERPIEELPEDVQAILKESEEI